MSGATHFTIGCVGKPSAGKSSFLNAATDANAKVGNYPFTTIEPNLGVTYWKVPCPCTKFNKTDLCKPRYGKCENGTRYIPIKMLDVAGLVPGASEGRGLGNKFLDDLRGAHVLLHIIDVAGRTNEKGEETIGYDPLKDIEWLQSEIHNWIFNNLWKKWPSITRRHVATKSTAAITLQLQFSGYGTNLSTVQKVLDKLDVKEPSNLEKWDEAKVHKLVDQFIEERFPTILVLNKIDLPEADANIARICQKYPQAKIALTSALAEIFLRKLAKQTFIRYSEGAEYFFTKEDEEEVPPGKPELKELDEKTKNKLEKIKDMILLRFGTTGIQDAIHKAVTCRKLIPVYPVKNIHNFTCDSSKHVFCDCTLVYPKTTVREFCGFLSSEMEKHFLYAEGITGQRMGEDEEIREDNNIIKFTTAANESSNTTFKEVKSSDKPETKNKPKAKTEKDSKNEE